jgi:hypothetical protein
VRGTRVARVVVAVGACLCLAACTDSGTTASPAAPSATPLPSSAPVNPTLPSSVVLAFNGGSGSLTSFTESGFTVAATSASWFFSNYGAPGPALQFSTAAGVATEGEVKITAGGARFQFTSVDIYSSTTRIPYMFTGFAGSAAVFNVSGVQGHTFGSFAKVPSGRANISIDTLLIHLTNSAAVCCSNPMGIDNVAITR